MERPKQHKTLLNYTQELCTYCGGGGETVMCARARTLLLFPYFVFFCFVHLTNFYFIYFVCCGFSSTTKMNYKEMRINYYRAIKWTCQYILENWWRLSQKAKATNVSVSRHKSYLMRMIGLGCIFIDNGGSSSSSTRFHVRESIPTKQSHNK